MDFKQLANYINRLITQTIFPSLKSLFSEQSERIEKAIQGKEYETINTKDISDPIVSKLDRVERAIINQPQELKISNSSELKPDFSELINTFKDEIKKLDKKVEVKQGDVKVDIDIKGILKSLEKIEKKIPVLEKEEVIDYTMMFSEMMSIMERSPYSLDLLKISQTLENILKKDSFKIPENLITEQGIKVVPYNNKIWGSRGAYDTIWLKNSTGTKINPSTADNQTNGTQKTKIYGYDVDTDGSLQVNVSNTGDLITRIKGSGSSLPVGTVYNAQTEEVELYVKDVGVSNVTQLLQAPDDIEGTGIVSVGTTAVEVALSLIPKTIIISAPSSNTGILYVGKSNVTSAGANAFCFLEASESIEIDYNDNAENPVPLYVVASVAGQSFIAGCIT